MRCNCEYALLQGNSTFVKVCEQHICHCKALCSIFFPLNVKKSDTYAIVVNIHLEIHVEIF